MKYSLFLSILLLGINAFADLKDAKKVSELTHDVKYKVLEVEQANSIKFTFKKIESEINFAASNGQNDTIVIYGDYAFGSTYEVIEERLKKLGYFVKTVNIGVNGFKYRTIVYIAW